MGIRVMIGSNNETISKQLARFLTENGMLVIGETTDAYDLLRKVHTVYPELVIIDDRMKGMLGHEISETLVAEKVCPVIALIRASEMGNYINLNQEAIFANVIKPCGRDMLINTIMLLVKTTKSISALENEVGKLKETKDNKVVIQEAKKLLMEHMSLSEEEAHRRIQKRSMDKGLAKVKIAEMIIRMYRKRI